MEFVREILARLNNDEDLTSDVIVETIKQEFKRKRKELYDKWDSCQYEYELCKKEYDSWQESGFSLNYEFSGCHTLLSMAAQDDYRNIIKTLMKSGVNIDGDLKYTPLHQAVKDGRKEMVAFLLENGANVNWKAAVDGYTPLHFAIEESCDASRQGNIDDYKKYVEIIEFLIANKADVNAEEMHKSTPLHKAVGCFGNMNVARLLIASEANVNIQNDNGNTPLHFSTSAGKTDEIRLLIDHGANVNVHNGQGETPLHRAHCKDTVKLLIEKGAKVDAKDNKGFTALHSAACSYYDETKILTLIKHGADPWAKSNEGSTPIDYYIREWKREGQPPEPGYLMKLKKAYDKDLIVRYSTLLIGAMAAITLFTTGNITPDAPRIIGAAALVTVAALAAGRITYEAFKPSTKMEEIKQERLVQEDKAR